MKVSVNCQACGRSFLVKPFRATRAKFCSMACIGSVPIRGTVQINHGKWYGIWPLWVGGERIVRYVSLGLKHSASKEAAKAIQLELMKEDLRVIAEGGEIKRPKRRPFRSLTERFWLYVKKGPHCWEWVGNRDALGYGRISVNGRSSSAHRLSYEIHHGKPQKPVIRHSCDNPGCVNPDHLIEGTHRDNVNDMISRGRAWFNKKHNLHVAS